MAAANRRPPFVVLLRSVELKRVSDERQRAWGTIRCPNRKAYGCGEHGQELVEGLALHLRIVDDLPNLTSSLCVRVSDQALRIIQAELGEGNRPLVQIVRGGGRGMRARGLIHQAGEGLVAFSLLFLLSGRDRAYDLVYDAAGESLSMAADPLQHRAGSNITAIPVPVRRRDGGVDLLVMAKLLEAESPGRRRRTNDGVFCVWPMGPPADLPSSGIIDPWQIKKRRFQGEAGKWHYLYAHVAFSFQGQAFWANFMEGVILHCDLRAAGGRSHVDFDLISLPPGLKLDFDTTMGLGVGNMCRTMGSTGDSVKFVSIDPSGDFGSRMVMVWTLHLDHGRSRWWSKDAQFSVTSLWELEDFKKARLPENMPKCPVVLPDGALWLLLPNMRKTLDDSMDDHICILDVRNMRILWSGRLSGFHSNQPAAVLPSSFFNSLDPRSYSIQEQAVNQIYYYSAMLYVDVASHITLLISIFFGRKCEIRVRKHTETARQAVHA